DRDERGELRPAGEHGGHVSGAGVVVARGESDDEGDPGGDEQAESDEPIRRAQRTDPDPFETQGVGHAAPPVVVDPAPGCSLSIARSSSVMVCATYSSEAPVAEMNAASSEAVCVASSCRIPPSRCACSPMTAA